MNNGFVRLRGQVQRMRGPQNFRGTEHYWAVAIASGMISFLWLIIIRPISHHGEPPDRLCTIPTYHLHKVEENLGANKTCQQVCTLSIQQHRDALLTAGPDTCQVLIAEDVSGQNSHGMFDWLYWDPVVETNTVASSADLQLTTCMCRVQLTAQRQILSKESMPEPAYSIFYSKISLDCSFLGVSKRLQFNGWQALTPREFKKAPKPRREYCQTKILISNLTSSKDIWTVLYHVEPPQWSKSPLPRT